MNHLMGHSGLREAGVVASAALECAASELSLSSPYCRYLASTMSECVAALSDSTQEQPQSNQFSVFSQTWHASSLARLSDADVANVWRLAEYLLLDADCVACLLDIAA